MEEHYKLTDNEFEQEFELKKMDPKLFTHEAHLRLTWIHINKYGFNEAINNIEKQIKHYVKHLGAEDKYHQTITIAAINAVNHFIMKSPSNNFKDFIEENSILKTNFKKLINSHYSYDIFELIEAKTKYIQPDVQPFLNE